ncbi:hypothetical protein [Mesorhizobium sp. M0058]|uniref:hypothetical protein n=1 Tax=Mesorhizobium sp. M0058 TaxID=2956865 RepID=UPI0033380C52
MTDKWRRKSTSTEVDLSDFSRDQLLQALIDDDSISESEALAIMARRAGKEKVKPVLERSSGSDFEELSEVRDELARGRRDEALIHLERFLGRGYAGSLLS